MLKICKENWAKYSNNLKERFIREHQLSHNVRCYEYRDIVKLIFREVMHDTGKEKWDHGAITEINDGDYQGTLLFVIPRSTYQPSSYDYLITYIEYGSCSCCDTLQCIQDDIKSDEPLSEEVLNDLMDLCKAIVFNIKRPFYEKFIISDTDMWAEVEYYEKEKRL